MSNVINLAGLTPVNDPAYRYRMPKIIVKVEGRGNGIKTVLTNVQDVANALNREAHEITKFFGYELGAQTAYVSETDRAVINGAHLDTDLQTLLSKYIELFVLCRNCRLPETHYKIKSGIIKQRCFACGHKESVDMTHKLTTFILAQYKKAKRAAAAQEAVISAGDVFSCFAFHDFTVVASFPFFCYILNLKNNIKSPL
jgi:translation initiation factor 5